jgi:hypothetical protein
MNATSRFSAVLLTALTLAIPLAANADDKAPMPQTKGMAGMDPAQHDQWAKEKGENPHKDCKPDTEAAAVQAKHPMPETKGMKGMDPKAHEVDCPEAAAAPAGDKARHVHKAPGG